jgi:hypothetical protein
MMLLISWFQPCVPRFLGTIRPVVSGQVSGQLCLLLTTVVAEIEAP